MTERMVLKVQGMDCTGCEQRLTAAVQRVEECARPQPITRQGCWRSSWLLVRIAMR
ncbi:heavy-metal-associated domain-containing protein [Streptomyces sp. NPDC006385]|uniref:heavy-metal-associated domain-containing protein n=1 Tax=Streptomyces sp. NPDC006385 TaxID=3156761 RepID=UPI0033AFD9B9